jgi:beta-N-acetylglucosaminidase
MINDGVQIAASDRRWNATNPGPDQLATDLDLNDEVTWRLNGMDVDDEEEKAG